MREWIIAAAVAVGTSGAAEAAVYRYDYQGLPMYTPEGEYFNTISGYLIIDEAMYPGGRVAGSSLSTVIAQDGAAAVYVEQQGVTYTAFAQLDGWNGSDWSFAGLIETRFGVLTVPVAYSNSFNLVLDSNADVVTGGGSETMGGPADYSFGNGSPDSSWYPAESAGPGTWTKTVISPIPLPAAAPLLLTGAALLLALRRRRA